TSLLDLALLSAVIVVFVRGASAALPCLFSSPTRRSSDLAALHRQPAAAHPREALHAGTVEMPEAPPAGRPGRCLPIHRLTALERSEEHTPELQSRFDIVCRLLLEKQKKN